MKNILVPIDFEKETNVLVEQAFELARKFGSKVWLLHVAAPDPDFVGYAAGPQNEIDFRADELQRELSTIEQFVRQLKEVGIAAEGLLIKGPTVPTILRKIENLDIDLVIIGHHRHNMFYKTFVGNTDAALVNKSKIPVLLVPLTDAFMPETKPAETEELTIAF
jgi:nucleotide-binding universal stress UspA family protein